VDPLTTKLKNLEERAKRRSQERQELAFAGTPQIPKQALVVPFPVQWGEDIRATPDICLRSALFGVVQRGKRRYLEDELLAAQVGYEVRYTGMRLDQNDLDVWQQVVHLCRGKPMGERVAFSLYSLLKAIGRCTGKHDYVWLDRSLIRLRAHAVKLKAGARHFVGGLIDEYGVDKETSTAYVRINPQLVRFFETDQYTLIDFRRRLSIRSQLGRWLHDFYSTHANPYPLKVKTLHTLCGSEIEELFHFRAELKKALAELVQADLLTGWEISRADTVSVRKRSSASQNRHLIRKAHKKLSEPKK
jgi:hypothetical protein